jgi:DNA-binding transcriptional ArsR family regulator
MLSADRHDCVVALKALGEETRVRIVGLLLDQPMEVGTIAKRLAVSQYNVSKHLRILREAGLLQAEKDGRRHLYALVDTVRSESAATGVLNLGCCSFQFDEAAPRSSPGKPRKRARRSPTRRR